MIDSLPATAITKQLNAAYYGKLVPADILVQILNQFDDEESRHQAYETILAILDRAALHAVMAYLTEHEDKVAFLELLRDEYDSNHPLEWATLKFDNAEQVVREAVERSLLAIHSALKEHI